MTDNTHTVDTVEQIALGRRVAWMVGITAPDGQRHAHAFPADVLAWRAAEYEIDPADSQTLLDMVLHERFMDPSDPDHLSPDFVFSTDPQTALRAYRRRVDRAKDRGVVSDPGGLLAPVHDHHRAHLDLEAHKDRVKQVRAARAHHRRSRANG